MYSNGVDSRKRGESVMKKYKVVVEQRNVFYIDDVEAGTAKEARQIALEHRSWDEDQIGEDTYDFEITVEEV